MLRRTPRRTAALLTLVALALGLGACAVPRTEPGPSPSPSPSATAAPLPSPSLRLPDAVTTVLTDADPAARSVAASSALFATSPMAVVAAADDLAAQVRAAGLAVTLGGPLLLVGSDTTAAADELARLEVAAVLTVGAVPQLAATLPGVVVVAAPAEGAALARVLADAGIGGLAAPVTVGPGGEVAAVAALDRAAPALLAVPQTEPTAGPEATPAVPSTAATSATTVPTPGARPSPGAGLPRTAPATTPPGGLVLATGDPSELAAVATARAAGQRVVVVPGGDPRANAATVDAVAAAHRDGVTHVLVVGPGLGAPERVAWTVSTAATGVQLPGGGQLALEGKRMVALYGTPVFAGLGLLGEQDLPSTVVRARGLAAEYQALTGDVVVPTFEIIATVASAGPGDDGNYSNELAVDTLLPWVEAAAAAGVYVILDLQPGRTDFLTQAMAYEPLLRYPHVGLALDPEWRLAPDQVHLRQIGSVGVDEVNAVVAWLADLTRTHALPQKVLVLHQFMLRMIDGREQLDTSREELAVVLHVDGQGSQPAKAGTWAALQVGAPAGVRWGWKNFVDEDVPMLTPAQTYQVVPLPDLVTYQ